MTEKESAETRFTRAVTEIIDRYEKRILPKKPPRERFRSEEIYQERIENFEQRYEECQREVSLLRAHLLEDRPSIEYDRGEELKNDIATKLAISAVDLAQLSDWWWTPADDSVRQVLAEVQRALDKETRSKFQSWRTGLSYVWSVLVELIYLILVVALFSAATSKFETLVFSVLVMIYNAVTSRLSGIGVGLSYLLYRGEETHGEIGRALKLKVPVAPSVEVAKQIRKSTVMAAIHQAAVGIGSLIALWHLFVTLVE